MKNKILELINTKPKHYSRMIQNNNEMKEWVIKNSLITSNNFVDHIYSAVHQVGNMCQYGNIKKYRGPEGGFTPCGPAAKCQCVREAVSQKVSETKQKYTTEDHERINAKRVITSLEKYGVTNNGQIEAAKEAHKKLYADKDAVFEINQRVKSTKLEKYGIETYNNRDLAKQTSIERYGVDNPWLKREVLQNPNLDILKDKEQMSLLFPDNTVEQIAEQLEVHIGTVYRYLLQHGLREKYKSTFEQEIVAFIDSLGITNIIRNSRFIISKELDIYLPDYNLAIEYNGIYYHHEGIPHIHRTYHYDKFFECEKLGITLFSIFSDSWENKKDIWKAKIKNKLGLNDKQVYARKCKIVELTNIETKQILNDNHVQGYCHSQLRYGLIHDNNLVAVMTFSKKRYGLGKKRNENDYELVRYATTCNVVGGASKLLAHFEKIHSPNIIFSYSDNQYSTGHLYETLGFILERENKCGYWYYDNKTKKSFNRLKFTKKNLVKAGHDPKSTERQIMHDLGYLCLWDCGSRTWIKSVG